MNTRREAPPVNADGAQVQDAGGTHHHIQSEQDVAVDETEVPASHHLHTGRQTQTFLSVHDRSSLVAHQGLSVSFPPGGWFYFALLEH